MRYAKTLLISAVMSLGLASASHAGQWMRQVWATNQQIHETHFVSVPSTCSLTSWCGLSYGQSGGGYIEVRRGSTLVLIDMYSGSTPGGTHYTVTNKPAGSHTVQQSASGTNGTGYAILSINW